MKAAAAHIRANYADLHAAGKVKLICVGRKGFDFFVKNNYEIVNKHVGIFAGLNFGTAQRIISEVVQNFLKGDYDHVEIVYNEFKSIIQQRLVIEQVIPIPAQDIVPSSQNPNPKSQVDYIYEPSSAEIVSALVPKHLNFQMWRVLLESNAAEQGARMTAMDNATTNASDLIRTLQLSYNKARQASITKELLEIVSGAEALKKAG
jgi:F-type H+-transporting ATPase subunit gamma